MSLSFTMEALREDREMITSIHDGIDQRLKVMAGLESLHAALTEDERYTSVVPLMGRCAGLEELTEGDVSTGIEGIGNAVKKTWEWIKNALLALLKSIKNFAKNIFSFKNALKKKNDESQKELKDGSFAAIQKESKKWIRYLVTEEDGELTPTKLKANIVTTLSETKRLYAFMIDRIKASEPHIDALGKRSETPASEEYIAKRFDFETKPLLGGARLGGKIFVVNFPEVSKEEGIESGTEVGPNESKLRSEFLSLSNDVAFDPIKDWGTLENLAVRLIEKLTRTLIRPEDAGYQQKLQTATFILSELKILQRVSDDLTDHLLKVAVSVRTYALYSPQD